MADALFRGVYAQTLIAAIEWTNLREGSILVIEGIEDVDVRTRLKNEFGEVEENSRFIQIKQLDQNISARTADVAYTIAQFAHGYVQARRRHVSARFVFTTSAGRARQQTANENARVVLDIDVLKEWALVHSQTSQSALANLWKNIRSLLLGNLHDFGTLRRELSADIEELDRGDSWKEFIRSVDWSFDHGDVGTLFRKLTEIVTRDPRFSEDIEGASPEYFARELIVELVHRAGFASLEKRTLDRLSFSRLIAHAALTLNAAKPGALKTYQEHIYLETECWGVRSLCLLRVSSIDFLETETAAFFTALNGRLADLGYPSATTVAELIERDEALLYTAAWIRTLPLVAYVRLVHAADEEQMSRARRNLETSAEVRLSGMCELLEELGSEEEYCEFNDGSGFIDCGSEFRHNVTFLTKLIANVIAAKLLVCKEGVGARRLYESVRLKVKVAIGLDLRVFSEPDRPIL